MSPNLDEIAAAALKLPEDSRAELVERLLLSFRESSDLDDPVAQAWLDEAERRDRAMTEAGDEGIPAEQVFQRLRSRRR